MTWAFGHTHYNCRQYINGAFIFSNQRGYYPKGIVKDYSNSYYHEIKYWIFMHNKIYFFG